MTLDEVRVQIDSVDTQLKPLFLSRMECGKGVAEAKTTANADAVFVPEREAQIIGRRASDVDGEVHAEYVMFLRHLMSLCRRYEYRLMPYLQKLALDEALSATGLDAAKPHTRIDVRFTCPAAESNLNLFINMAALNAVEIETLSLSTENGVQQVSMTLCGNLNDEAARVLVTQMAKEANDFALTALR